MFFFHKEFHKLLAIPGFRGYVLTLSCFSFSTETGGVCIAPRPAEPGAEIRPAMAMRPFFGIQPALMDEKVKSASLTFIRAFKMIKLVHESHIFARIKLYRELSDKIIHHACCVTI